MKLKLDKDIKLLRLDGKWVPFEDAGDALAIVQFRVFACAAKDGDGKNKGAYICLSVVEATETEQGKMILPKFVAEDLTPPAFNIPAAGSGSAPSPDEPAAAAEPAASAGKAKRRTRPE